MPQTSHTSNFAFLAEHDERLAKIGYEAEQLVGISPTACMMQIRMLAELLARETAAYVGVYVDDRDSFYDILRRLEREAAFQDDIEDLFHDVRMNANDVVHGEVYLGDSKGVAMNYLRLTRRIAIWFHQSFGRDRDFSPGPFIEPPDLASQRQRVLSENRNLQQAVDDAQQAVEEANARALRHETSALRQRNRYAEAEELLDQLREERNVFRELAEEYEERLVGLQSQTQVAGADERIERQKRMRHATDNVELDERESRAIIDSQLRQRGWRADTDALRWSTGTRPTAGEQLAIAEVPTAAGTADYVLFDGLIAVAIIEAMPWNEPARDGIEQAKLHSRAWDRAMSPPVESPWAVDGVEYEVPFVFASNGREYQQRRETDHGLWFADLRRADRKPHGLAEWCSPRDIRALLDGGDEVFAE